MTKFAKHLLALCSVCTAAVVAYLPAVRNSFISDDFAIFPFLNAWKQYPLFIFDATSELFRLTSYLYFGVLFKIFGATPEPYYWASIALHALVSILVYILVLRVTGSFSAAWPAALFFAVYERHQEAVMWISAANETILTLSCLLFLLLWEYGRSRNGENRLSSVAALIVFVFALFSKESAVALAPLALLTLFVNGYKGRQVLENSIPVLVLLTAFLALWLSQADRNFFVTDRHYALTLHAVPVYGRALLRLLLPAIPSLAGLFLLTHRGRQVPWKLPIIFFAGILAVAIVPYSFLTYQDHLPSRHTYFPSVGLAGLVGISFAGVHAKLLSARSKHVVVALFSALILGNIGYIWLKKEPQFQERAAPTRELIKILNSNEVRDAHERPLHICAFPLQHPWWFADAVSRFTSFSSDEVVLQDNCTDGDSAVALMWDSNAAQYKVQFPNTPIVEAAVAGQLTKP